MNDFGDISSALYFAGAVAMATGLVLLGVFGATLWSRKRREHREPERDFFQDITNISILFQSMRDVLRQQKELAADLNRSMEKNAAAVQKAVGETQAELARVREMHRQLAFELEEIRANAAVSGKPVQTAGEGSPPVLANGNGNGHGQGNGHEVREKDAEEGSVLNILSEPAPAEAATGEVSAWVGLDFGRGEQDEPVYDGPDSVPDEPEDGQAARQAFRALLGMDEEEDHARAILTSSESPKQANGNGNGVPLISERVYDYCDAGMTVPQISRELGIGKGEVRLILSLRKDKDG